MGRRFSGEHFIAASCLGDAASIVNFPSGASQRPEKSFHGPNFPLAGQWLISGVIYGVARANGKIYGVDDACASGGRGDFG